MNRRLIFSADDFGISAGVNAAIVRAHREGLLTQTSLMVNARAADDAVRMAKANPDLAVGLHLALVQGYPVLPPDRIPLLVGDDGLLRRDPVWNGIRYYFVPGVYEQIRCEVVAQLERFHDYGLKLSHLDGHLTVHMHPTVIDILCDVAPRFGVRAMRLSGDPYFQALRYDATHFLRKSFEGLAFTGLARFARPRVESLDIRHADRVYGMHQTGHVTEDYLLETIPKLGPGLTEIYSHPGAADEEALKWRPADYDPQGELAALLSPRVRAAVEQAGIELTSYAREISK